MPEDPYEEYREHLRQGGRIEIGIPLAGGGVFRDWAIIHESGGDEIVAQVSRDTLPANVRVDEGFILDVSIRIKEDVYTCSGIVMEKGGEGRELRIRLFALFTLRERRQFFRSYLSLRVRYALVDDASREQLERDWEKRKDLEHMRFQGYDDFMIAGQRARYTPLIKLEWRDFAMSEINLGGGGISIKLPQPVQAEQLVALEIHLPLAPPRVVHSVARVIHGMSVKGEKGGKLYRAGMQFLLLDESDRDLVFRLISATQLSYLRKLAEKRDPALPDGLGGGAVDPRRQMLYRGACTLILVVAACYLMWYLVQYQKKAPPNEIGETYEKALRQYRHQEK